MGPLTAATAGGWLVAQAAMYSPISTPSTATAAPTPNSFLANRFTSASLTLSRSLRGAESIHTMGVGVAQMLAKRPENPQIAAARTARATTVSPSGSMVGIDGKGHREADPPAVADLIPDGRAPAGHGSRDSARRGGLQRDERGRVRSALLRGPLGA